MKLLIRFKKWISGYNDRPVTWFILQAELVDNVIFDEKINKVIDISPAELTKLTMYLIENYNPPTRK